MRLLHGLTSEFKRRRMVPPHATLGGETMSSGSMLVSLGGKGMAHVGTPRHTNGRRATVVHCGIPVKGSFGLRAHSCRTESRPSMFWRRRTGATSAPGWRMRSRSGTVRGAFSLIAGRPRWPPTCGGRIFLGDCVAETLRRMVGISAAGSRTACAKAHDPAWTADGDAPPQDAICADWQKAEYNRV